MKRLTFEKIMQLWLILAAMFGVIIIIFTVISIEFEISAAKHSYTVTQNDVSYVGSIIRGDDYIKVIGKDNNMVILDAAHGPIIIRRSALEEYPIDVQ